MPVELVKQFLLLSLLFLIKLVINNYKKIMNDFGGGKRNEQVPSLLK